MTGFENMEIKYYDEMFLQESYYWWHVGKRRLVRELIEKYHPGKGLSVVEFGCGAGQLLSELQQKGFTTSGFDSSQISLQYCIRRGLKNIGIADFNHDLPIKDNSANIVVCLDVIEHVKYDQRFIGEVCRILKPGGIAIFTAPAYKALWSYWDEVLKHKRRYDKKSFRALIDPIPWQAVRVGYFNTFIFLPVLLWRSIKGRLGNTEKFSSDFVNVPNWINRLLIQLNRVELEMIKLGGLPFGLSLFSVLRKGND